MSKEPIHSGHFMTSNPHSEIQPDDEDEDVEVDVVDVDEGVSTAPLDKNALKEKDAEKPVTFYKFGPQKTQSIAIDVSLNKLNKCIRVAYMKMTTPKWKDFKGIKLQWKHRIRLNNVIWRAYYMEFRKPGRKRRSPYCYFSVPDDDMTHAKIEGSVLEGMYWKRRMEAVCAQYKRWRAYFSRRKRCCRKRGNSCGCDTSTSNHHLLLPINETSNHHSQLLLSNQQLMRSMTPDNLSTMATECFLGTIFDLDDDMDNEFTNQLFEQLNAPFIFPNPKEGASVQCDNADILQPGLLSLQPSIEEIMSTDYPFGSDYSNQLPSNPPSQPSTVEYSNNNTLINRERSTSITTRSQQIHSKNTEVNNNNCIPLQQQQYTSREYDAANMLLNYSGQTQNFNLQTQQQLNSNKSIRRHQRQLSETSITNSSCHSPFIEIQSAIPQVLTPPNISNPLYSQAAAYETQKIAAALRGHSEIHDRQKKLEGFGSTDNKLSRRNTYNNNVPLLPPPMSKMANQTSTTHQIITSVASSSHPSHFSSPINYSLIAAATSNAVSLSQAAFGQTSLASSLSDPNSHWSSSFNSQQQQSSVNQHQQIYPFLQQTSTTTSLLRKTCGNDVTPSRQQSIHSQNISSRNFSTQSLLSNSSQPVQRSSFPSTNSSLVASLVSSTSSTKQQLNEQQHQQSFHSNHLINKSLTEQQSIVDKIDQNNHAQLLHSLTDTNNNNDSSIVPQTAVKQFVMSDLSRYLTQQTPIVTNSSFIQGNNTSITGFGRNSSSSLPSTNALTTNCSSIQNSLSPHIADSVKQQYSSPSLINNNNTSLSVPIQQINEFQGGEKCQKKNQYLFQQPPSLHSSSSTTVSSNNCPTAFSLPRKMSVSSAFSSPNNNNFNDFNNQKKCRGASFSSSSILSTNNNTKPQISSSHLGKRQIQNCQTTNSNNSISPPQKQKLLILQQQNNIENNNNNTFVDEPEFTTLEPVLVTTESQQQTKQQWSNNNKTIKRRHYRQQQSSTSPLNDNSSSLSPPIIIPQQQQSLQQKSYCFNKHLPPSNEALLLHSLIENKNKNFEINDELKQHKLLELGQFKQKQNLEVKKEEDVLDNNNFDETETNCLSTTSIHSPFSSNNINESSPYFSESTTTILTTEDDTTIDIYKNSTSGAIADSTLNPDERKRLLHLNAEKNRRSALKEGFDCLVRVIPVVEQAGLKSTNAVVLNRAAQHIKDLKMEQERQLNQIKAFKEKIACMNERISLIQSNLPSSNLSGSKSNENNSPTIRIQLEQFFERYKRDKSQENHKFWLMSEVLKPIVYSFAEKIYPDSSNRERLILSTQKWLETNWNSVILRPIASDTLVRLATTGGAFTNEKALNNYISQQLNQEVLPSNSSTSTGSFVRKK